MTKDEPTDGTDGHEPMRHEDFAIGREFETATGTWRCTDVGTRTIVAIKVSDHQDDPSWFNGPPYAVAEMVFDEDDLKGCSGLQAGKGPSVSGRGSRRDDEAS